VEYISTHDYDQEERGTMKVRFFRHFIAIFIIMLLSISILAGEATDRIKAATDKLIEIVSSHDLDQPEMAEKRARMIRETVDTVFDWSAFSQRALGKHWSTLSQPQKKEFILFFGQLLERTYMDKTRQYSGEKIIYLDEKIDGKYGVVGAKVTLNGGKDVAIEYRIIKPKDKWFIYDVYVEGISLVSNYRSQFNIILTKSGYDELIKKLKTKLDEQPQK
jgi:phospholipid transport system substrate-binding protein